MLIQVKLNYKKIFLSKIRGNYAFLKNIIIIIKNTQDKILYVDYTKSRLGDYSPPIILKNMTYYYEVAEISEEQVDYIECIAKAVEDKMHPIFKNKRLECKKDVTVIID